MTRNSIRQELIDLDSDMNICAPVEYTDFDGGWMCTDPTPEYLKLEWRHAMLMDLSSLSRLVDPEWFMNCGGQH